VGRGGDWIGLAQDINKWPAAVYTAINITATQNMEFLITYGDISVSRRNLKHAVSVSVQGMCKCKRYVAEARFPSQDSPRGIFSGQVSMKQVQVFLCALNLFPIGISPPMLHIHSFTNPCYIILSV
jgi:hypothetical protein